MEITKPDLVEGLKGTGGYQDKFDSRDIHYEEIAKSTPPFNWNIGFDVEKELSDALGKPNFKIPVKDQGTSSSCGGQAWGYLAEVLEGLSTKTYEERSAKYIYAQTAVPGGGSAGRANADIFIKQGVARESFLPSLPPTETNLTAAIDITPKVRENATNSMSRFYAQTGTDIDTVAQAMRDNYGVVIGITGENNGTWLSAFPKPPTKTEWRHWVFAGKAKIINGKKHIGILNSWGVDTGEKGWQWLSEDYFNKFFKVLDEKGKIKDESAIWSGWTHVFSPPIDGPLNPSIGPFTLDLHLGTSGPEITRLQSFLSQLGYFNAEATGFYGPLTRQAVFAFQKAYTQLSWWELRVLKGSKVGTRTRAALNALIK